ncbi:MAG: UDP-N-acetylmuramate dehydrogenase [Candidatus Saganbacteria bacterium]|nr:UDP-N-acetylmuramate dehydrogenase [Candidatus Saganbacteria bacterium]
MKILRNESLKKHTSFRIGGPADYFSVPGTIEELRRLLVFAAGNRLPLAVMGAGTNLLALDKGFHGLVIKLAGGLDRLTVRGSVVQAGAGLPLSKLLKSLAGRGLTGLEFLAGIPGTVGGAAVMNAGAWGKELGRYIDRIKVLDRHGELSVLKKGQLGFGYRKSNLQNGRYIVAEVVFRLRRGRPRRIKGRFKGFLARRKASQPLGCPNAGSIFKNPKGKFAGRLLEEAGCKGVRVGDAQVSAKHANFIVNLGEARARDVIKLMTRMQNSVKKRCKVRLEPELKIMVQSSLT